MGRDMAESWMQLQIGEENREEERKKTAQETRG